MAEINAATFDVTDMFTGIAYPTEVIPFYTNPEIAYEIDRLNKLAPSVIAEKDEAKAKKLKADVEALHEKAAKFRYEIHLRGSSREKRDNLIKSADEKFETETDFLGREKPNAEKVEYLENAWWALHIEKIVAPNGAIKTVPEPAEIAYIRGEAPDSETKKVSLAIKALTENVASGIEAITSEADFLSQR